MAITINFNEQKINDDLLAIKQTKIQVIHSNCDTYDFQSQLAIENLSSGLEQLNDILRVCAFSSIDYYKNERELGKKYCEALIEKIGSIEKVKEFGTEISKLFEKDSKKMEEMEKTVKKMEENDIETWSVQAMMSIFHKNNTRLELIKNVVNSVKWENFRLEEK